METEKQYAFDWIDKNKKRIIEISNQIWAFAELGLIETKSSIVLANELEKYGFTVKRGIANMPTAFLATWGESNPVIGILGEMMLYQDSHRKRFHGKNPWRLGNQAMDVDTISTEPAE